MKLSEEITPLDAVEAAYGELLAEGARRQHEERRARGRLCPGHGVTRWVSSARPSSASRPTRPKPFSRRTPDRSGSS